MPNDDKPSELKFRLRHLSNDEIDGILSGSTNKRLIRTAHQHRIGRLMLTGEWNWHNGDTLKFDERGNLVDGQHRLAAARIFQEETGRKAWFWCAENLPVGADEDLDQGANRTLTDVIRKDGAKYWTHCSTIARMHAVMALPASENLRQGVRGGADMPYDSKNVRVRPTLRMLIAAWRANRKDVEAWAVRCEKMRDIGLARASLMAALGFQFAQEAPARAAQFCELLISGEVKRSDPIAFLRRRLMKERLARHKLHGVTVAALAVKAWVAWCEGREIKNLRWAGVGPVAEVFPDHRLDHTLGDAKPTRYSAPRATPQQRHARNAKTKAKPRSPASRPGRKKSKVVVRG